MEIIITTLLFVTVSAAAYKIYVESTRAATEARQDSIEDRKLQQFFEKFRHQIENTIQLPNSESTVLQVEVEDDCINITEDLQVMGWGFIPFPGHDVALMNSTQNIFQPINPLDYTGLATPETSDAVRLIYVLADSQIYHLTLNGTDPYPTIQSTGTEPIVISSDAPLTIKVGDFAVISDALRSDLFRITGINPGTNPGEYEVFHDPSVSSWNVNFLDDYGKNVQGGAFIYKVGVSSFALDTASNTLMEDTHMRDDGFNGTDFTSGPPGLLMNWSPVASDIQSFQIIVDSVRESTRTPRAGVPGKTYETCQSVTPNRLPAFCECENQLGNPGIIEINLKITHTE